MTTGSMRAAIELWQNRKTPRSEIEWCFESGKKGES